MRCKATPEQIDALLPQTQCELCGYKGCMPYATAIAEEKAAINLCPPGGINGLIQLANLLDEDPTPYFEDMQKKAKPKMIANIREAECIGCTKCIQACPVDAILGTGKKMHTVITDECTGCELCVAPCPVDCIDMLTVGEQFDNQENARARYYARQKRLNHSKTESTVITPSDHEAYLQAALMRKFKK